MASGYTGGPPGFRSSPHVQQPFPAPAMSVATNRSPMSITSNVVNSGTEISDKGVVTVSIILDSLEIPFMAIRDSVRFLHSLYPKWSIPAFKGGNAYANEIGATYVIETIEKHTVDNFDAEVNEISVRKRKSITIRDIQDNQSYKIIHFAVQSKIESDVVNDPFPPTTFIHVEIKNYAYDQGKFLFTVAFDGGPPDIELSYCCLCFVNPASRKSREDAFEMKPKILAQVASIMGYIRNFNPNDPIARKVSAANASNKYSSMDSANKLLMPSTQSGYRSNYVDDDRSQGGSKLSKGSKGYEPHSYMRMQGGRADSTMAGGTAWSTGSPTAASSSADEIKKLYELYQVGALSKNEFETEKRKIMETTATLF